MRTVKRSQIKDGELSTWEACAECGRPADEPNEDCEVTHDV